MPNTIIARLTRQLLAARIIPVLRYCDADTAWYAADIAIRADYAAIELTCTTPGALDVLHTLRQQHGQAVLLGVGTVLDGDMAHAALKAGADFLVSPCLAADIANAAHDAGKPCLLGAYTPSEVMAALRMGADMVKIFPASSGGPAHLAALRAVFPHIALCPTGGITGENLHAYFKAGASCVGIGGALYDNHALTARDTARLIASLRALKANLP